MTSLDEAKKRRSSLRRSLLGWFRRGARELPWRGTGDPYRVWLAEILLQQTRVSTALPYYDRFVRAFPKVHDLAAASEQKVLKLWEGLGYYSRARNLHKAAKIIVNEHRGRFPKTAAEWQQLPGVGRYTAGAIASIAFGEPVPILDGNAKRVLSRVFAIEDCVDDAGTERLLWSIAELLVPQKSPGDFNQALMELGSRVCTPRSPLCGNCPVQKSCDAYRLGRQDKLPMRRKKKPPPHYEIVAAAIKKNGRFLLGRRPAGSLLGGLWEFPGGKVKRGETHEQALIRELKEELAIDVAVGAFVTSVKHAYSHFKITLHVYFCSHTSGKHRAHWHSEIKWVPRSHFDRYAFPAADRKFMHLL